MYSTKYPKNSQVGTFIFCNVENVYVLEFFFPSLYTIIISCEKNNVCVRSSNTQLKGERRYWLEGNGEPKEKFLTLGTFFVTTITCRCNRVIQYQGKNVLKTYLLLRLLWSKCSLSKLSYTPCNSYDTLIYQQM